MTHPDSAWSPDKGLVRCTERMLPMVVAEFDVKVSDTAIVMENCTYEPSPRVYLGDGRKANKDPGYCEREGIDHAYEVLPIHLLSDPPQSVRACTNCGKRQRLRHTEPTWE